MAPSIAAAAQPEQPVQTKKIQTTGQLDPVYDLLSPYEAYPKEITGRSVWKAEDFRADTQKWTYWWTPEQLEALSKTADEFLAAKRSLTTITKENFPLPEDFVAFLTKLRDDLINGNGFVLFKGFPVEEWGVEKAATAYMGIGTYLGYFVSQNRHGHILGHVKNLGEDPTQIDKVRIYRTNARQFFHCDDSDLVGLLCIHRAQEGGESDVVSAHHVWNTLQRERPDVARTLTEPIWYFDRKGEVSVGQKPYIKTQIFYWYDNKVYIKWDPYYVKSLSRFSDIGEIPPLSEAQLEAAHVLESTCQRLALHMILEVGDIQFVSNNHCLHARTAYTDWPAPKPRRHLMRLWLATPESEGGWKLPFADSQNKKRGGIQVDDTPERSPFDAE